MARSSHKARRSPPSDTKYEVGYGKPPKNTRFKPGQSGNPRGRPKGIPNRPLPIERLKSIVRREAYRKIKVKDGDRQVTMTMADAVIRSVVLAAAKGNARSQKHMTEMLILVESEDNTRNVTYVEAMIDYKLEGEKIIERAKRANVDPPEMLPHPDHVVVDLSNDRVYIVGPINKEEKALYDSLQQMRRDAKRGLAEAEAKLEDAADLQSRKKILKEIRHQKKLVEIFDNLYQRSWGRLLR